jgi:RimJ/RimL family protein N-acetyltransferase
MNWTTPLQLTGPTVRLIPLAAEHEAMLVDAVRDGSLWELWFTKIPSPEQMAAEIDRRLALQAAGTMLPFLVEEQATGRALGMTTFMNIDSPNRRLEIGSTWYRKSIQRTGVNTECKQLLLSHAFDTLGCIAVELRTSSFNRASRAAIERLGAKLDGILRSHQIVEGDVLRDTYVYSIVATEWPAVKKHLAYCAGRRI